MWGEGCGVWGRLEDDFFLGSFFFFFFFFFWQSNGHPGLMKLRGFSYADKCKKRTDGSGLSHQ